jgi:hypothetical protein
MATRLSICVLKMILGRGAGPPGRLSAFSTSHFPQVFVRAGVGSACGADCGPAERALPTTTVAGDTRLTAAC